MSLLLKQLNERRGAQIARAKEITQKAMEENRSFTDEERTNLTDANGIIEQCDADIQLELRSIANAGPPKTSPGEKRDLARFDYGVLLNHMLRTAKGAGGQIDGVEAEMIAQGESEARDAGLKSSGLFLPRVLVRGGAEHRDMTATGQTSIAGDQGGMTIATEKRGLLDDFFNLSVVRQAGATVFEGLVGNVDFPRLIAGTDPTKKGENENADEVNPATAMLHLTPKRLPAFIDISEQLLRQSSVTIETFVRAHLTAQMLSVQERAFFHGDGTKEPLGVEKTPGIGSVAAGTNGAAATYALMVKLRSAVALQNALTGNLSYISNTPVEGQLATTQKASGTDSTMVLNEFGGKVAGVPFWVSNAVSNKLSKGTSSNKLSAVFFANWADFYIGYWGGISLELIRDKALAISGMYSLVANCYYDAGVVRPKSFAAMLDVDAP